MSEPTATDSSLLSDDVVAECLTAISGGYCDTANALEEHIAAQAERIRELEAAAERLEKANTPFEDAAPAVEVFRHAHGWWCWRVGGIETGPCQTWREAYRCGEWYLLWAAEKRRADALEPAAAVVAGIERLPVGSLIQKCSYGFGVHHASLDDHGPRMVHGPTLADAVRVACERLEQEPRA